MLTSAGLIAMKRILVTSAALLLCGYAVFASHQTLPSKEEAEAALQHAADAVDFWEVGTPPYHLSAAVHLEIGGRKYDAQYGLWWAAPNKYRELFLMPTDAGTIVETDLALGNKFYTVRNSPTLSIPQWEVRNAIRGLSHAIYANTPGVINNPAIAQGATNIARVFAAEIGGVRKTCVDIRREREFQHPFLMGVRPLMIAEACFDSASGEVSSIMTKVDPALSTPGTEELARGQGWLADNFSKMGEKRFPEHMTVRNFDLKLDLKVRELVQTDKFPSDTFQAPAHSVPEDWCPNPTYDRSHSDIDNLDLSELMDHESFSGKPSPLLLGVPREYLAYYIQVGSDGRVTSTVPLRSGGPVIDTYVEQFFRAERFGILSCGAQRIPWEGIVNGLPTFHLQSP